MAEVEQKKSRRKKSNNVSNGTSNGTSNGATNENESVTTEYTTNQLEHYMEHGSFEKKEENAVEKKKRAPRKKKQNESTEQNEQTELMTQSVPEPQNGPKFVYFIRILDGTKSSESLYRVGYCDNVPETRKQLENNMPQNVKTDKVIECAGFNADQVFNKLKGEFKDKEVKRDWFKLTKQNIDDFITKLGEGHATITEGKAKVKKVKTKKN